MAKIEQKSSLEREEGAVYQRSQGASTVGIFIRVYLLGCLLADNDGDCARGIFPPRESTSPDQIPADPGTPFALSII